MLWHGTRAPAVAGVRRQPVSVGTLPTRVPTAQPGPPAGAPGRVREAVPVDRPPTPRRAGAAARGCARPTGAAALAQAAAAARRPGRRARPRWPGCAPRSAPSWPARPGSWPGCAPGPGRSSAPTPTCCFFTADTLEQAGRPALAARRAARLLAGGADSVADLGCAAGTDTIALARAGAARARRRPRPGRPRADRRERRRPRAGRPTCGCVAGDAVDLVAAARGGEVAGCGADRPRPRPPGRRTAAARPRPLVTAVVDGRARCWTAVPRGGREGGARARPRPGAGRRRGRVGLGRRLDRRGAAVGPRACRTTWRRATLVRDDDVARADRRRRPRARPGRPGARLAARARSGADPLRAGVARGRRPRRHADRPDDRLPDLRRDRPTPRGSAPTGSTRCCRST